MSSDPILYRTKQGDMLDAICVATYGASSGYMEAVRAANPGLAAKGEVYPEGLTILLPLLSPPSKKLTRLWD